MATFIVYRANKKTLCINARSLSEALHLCSSENLIFKIVYKNPNIVHPIYEGKVRKDIILRGDEIIDFTNVKDYLLVQRKEFIKWKMSKSFDHEEKE
jgi:hypothetical protein